MIALVLGGLVGFLAGLSPSSFHLSPSSFSFVSQAGCLWSGSWLACLPLPFVCFPLLFNCLPVLFTCLPSSGLSPTSFHLSPNSFHLSLPGWALVVGFPVVSHFFSFVSQAGCLWSASLPFICLPGTVLVGRVSRPACLPLPYICLPLLFICLPLLFICLPGWALVVGFTSFHLSPRLGACGRVSGRLVSHFLSFVSHFFFCILISVGPTQWMGRLWGQCQFQEQM